MHRFGKDSLARALFAGIALLAAFPSAAGDEDIFSSQIAPNVVLMVDNSGSMNAIMEHPSFDAETFTATCDVLPAGGGGYTCLLYTSPSPRDKRQSRMPSSA